MANNGTLARGTASFSAGAAKFGAAGLASGVYNLGTAVDSGLSSTGASGGNLTGPFTIEAWVKTTTTSTRVWAGHDEWFYVGVNASGVPTASLGATSGQVSMVGSAAINDGAWHHLALVIGTTSRRLYADGNQVATNSGTNTVGSATQALSVGGFTATLTQFDWAGAGGGVIDEVRVSNSERYTGATYTVPTGAFADDSNTLGLYHLESDATDSHGAAGASGTIAATDANIVYSPGNWGVSGANMKTINAGASARVRVTTPGATGFVLGFSVGNDLTPLPQVETRIDGSGWTSQEIAAAISVGIPATNAWVSHVIEFRVKSMTETQARWSTTSTEVVFTGITATGASSALSSAIKTRPLRGIYLGDSITEGVRTLGGTSFTKDTDRNSAAQGWAHLSAEMLGAEAGIIGFGGSGLTVVGSGGVPAVGTTYPLLWGSGPARDFTGLDFVVINEGTNDSAAASSTFTTAYTALLNGLIAATPSTCVIIVMRPFNGSHDTDIQNAALACSNPLRVAYLDTTGFFNTGDSFDGLHPYGLANSTAIAAPVAAAIKAVLKVQTTLLLNLGGAAVPAAALAQ